MRISKTYSLSEDLVKRITKFKKDNKLQSDSQALERMIIQNTEQRSLLKDIVIEVLTENNLNMNTDKPEVQVKVTTDNETSDEVTEALKNSMNDILKNIPKE